MSEFTHFDAAGNALMVDVSDKADTTRVAVAQGKICVSREIYEKIAAGSMAKGDVLGVARVAGIMAAVPFFSLIHTALIIPFMLASIRNHHSFRLPY